MHLCVHQYVSGDTSMFVYPLDICGFVHMYGYVHASIHVPVGLYLSL